MKVDFYVLEATRQKSLFFACRLLEKAYKEQKEVYVHVASQEAAEKLDDLLWTYKEDSFIPHALTPTKESYPSPILIGYESTNVVEKESLLNLCQAFLPFHTQFKHIIEIVFSDPHVQQLARERYRQYRDHHYEINTYKLKATEL